MTKPRQPQSAGVICDHTSAETMTTSTKGAHPPWASAGQTLFQFTAHSHHAIQATVRTKVGPHVVIIVPSE